tara:strand:+ start:1252 stop:1722 length:471 start_codon:yes stop_codon:yes gene_type:complete
VKVDVPVWVSNLSIELADSRTKISASIYNQDTDKYRGKQEKSISILGIKAELVVRHVVWEKEIRHAYFTPMIDTKPVVGADLVIGGETYDIKGVKRDKGYLMVNYDAHNNPEKICDWYVFVIFGDKDAEIKKISYTDVGKWSIADSTYTKVYRWKI